MKVLSTKSIDNTVIAHARSLGLEVECVDFIQIIGKEFDSASIKTNFNTIVFTSANAVKYFFRSDKASQFLSGKNIFSLLGKSQEELQKHNVTPVLVKENAEELSESIIKNKNSKSVLHICGNLTLDILENKLKTADIDYTRLIVYQTILKPQKLSGKEYDAIMFYSPSGMESFFSANEFDKNILWCCIGHSTAAALKEKYPEAKTILPQHPNPEYMIDAIYQFTKSVVKP